MKTEQILKADIEDIENLSRADLAKLVSQAARAANIRVKSLQEHNILNESLLGVYSSGGKFSVAGKDKTSLLNELKRIKGFMGGASTVTEARAENKSIVDRMKERGVIDQEDTRTEEDISKEFWEVMDKLRQTKPALFVNDCLLYADDVYSEIEQGKSANEAYDNIMETINEEQAEIAEREQEAVREWDKKIGW